MKRLIPFSLARERNWRVAQVDNLRYFARAKGASCLWLCHLMCGKALPYRLCYFLDFIAARLRLAAMSKGRKRLAESRRLSAHQAAKPRRCARLLHVTVANHICKHPVRPRHTGAQLPIPNHAGVDVMSAAVIRDKDSTF